MAASMRLSKAMEAWQAAMRGEGRAQGTIATRMSAMRQLIRVTGDLYVRSLTRRHIDKYFDTYNYWSPGMRNQRRLAISAFQNWAKRRGHMDRNVDLLDGMKRPAITKRKHTFLSEEQVQEMLDKCEDPRDRIIVAMSFYLGLRTSEVTPIKWGDLRHDWKRVRIRRSKKGTIREDDIPVRGKLRKELRLWQVAICRHMKTVRPDPEWYIITPKLTVRDRDPQGRYLAEEHTGYNPTRRLVRGAYKVVKTALTSIGVTERGEGTHTLRRSGAAIMRAKADEAGENGLRVTQLMLGHEAQSTTEGYLDYDSDRDTRDRIIEAFDDDPDDDMDSGAPDAEILVFPERGEGVGA